MIHHTFKAERTDRDYGQELDAMLTYPFSPRLTGLLKTADYNSDTFSSDERTFWLAMEYKY